MVESGRGGARETQRGQSGWRDALAVEIQLGVNRMGCAGRAGMDRIRETSPDRTCNSINLLQASSYDRVWNRRPSCHPKNNNPALQVAQDPPLRGGGSLEREKLKSGRWNGDKSGKPNRYPQLGGAGRNESVQGRSRHDTRGRNGRGRGRRGAPGREFIGPPAMSLVHKLQMGRSADMSCIRCGRWPCGLALVSWRVGEGMMPVPGDGCRSTDKLLPHRRR